MKSRETEILNQLNELCNNYAQEFTISKHSNKYSSTITVGEKIKTLDELNFSADDIERLNRQSKIFKIRDLEIEKLNSEELSRATYRLYTWEESIQNYQPSTMRAIKYIALPGGLMITGIGIIMLWADSNITGYDTDPHGNYGFYTITPWGMLSIGIVLIIISLVGFYRSYMKNR